MKYRYRTDDEMKDSGVEWLGRIPKEWEVSKLKYLANIKTGYTPPKDNEDNYCDTGIIWVKPDDLKEFSWIEDSKEKISTTGIKKQNLIPENSVLVCCIGSIGKFGINKIPVLTNQQINSLIFNNRVNENIRKYLICSSKDEHNKNSNGNVVKILNGENQGKIKFPLTSTIEQQKIASFLDKKTDEFDSIIEKKQSFITKLTEAKKSLISEVVTGKVKVQLIDNKYQVISRADDEMKDSGVEWLGKIPKEWEVKRLKRIVDLRNNKGVYISNQNYIALENIESKTGKYIENSKEEIIVDGICNIFFENDVLFGKLRPYLAKCIITSNKGFCSSELLVMEPISIKSKLLKYIILNDKFIQLVDSSTYGAKMPRASWNFIGEILISYPHSNEQQLIVDFLDEKTAKIDSTIEKINLQIEKLKVAKQSLISEAVTGKIEVLD